MPLLGHFRPPLDPRIGWELFHHRWANAIADHLDELLPPLFFARVEVHLGTEVATDVTEEELLPRAGANGSGGTAVQTYTPPAATVQIPTVFPDEAAVEVRSADPGARLLAVIEAVGAVLPVVRLYLRGHGCIPLDLESTYSETRHRVRY